MPTNGNGSSTVRLPVFLWVCGGICTICMGATGLVYSQQNAHAGKPGHAEIRERVGRMEECVVDVKRRLTNIETRQEQMQTQVANGFDDLKDAIREIR